MAFQHKPGAFTLFENKKKTTDNQPDYRGEGTNLDGEPIEVAAWVKDDKNGNEYFSCSFKLREERVEPPAAARVKPAPENLTATEVRARLAPPKPGAPKGPKAFEDMDDDIPF